MKINKDGSLIKYLRYALGEVLLVVIGILIAVSLNNWNKNRVKEKSFKGVVKNLVDDIKNDTALAGKYIRYYSENEKFFKKVMADSVTREMYLDEKSSYGSLITSIQPLALNTRGYELLKKSEDFGDEESSKFIVKVTQLFNRHLETFKLTNELLRTDVENTFMDWKNTKPWFSQMMVDGSADEFLDYMLNDPMYRNKVVYNYILVYGNYLVQLKQYKSDMKELLKESEKFVD